MILCLSLYQHTISTTNLLRMSEKLCLQWNDFKENVNSAFGKLRGDKEFTDVTLVCEDGQQMEAHKVILASSSPFFEKILQKSKHPHPLLYLKGFQSKDFASILDFLYFGEVNVYQEDLDSFLVIAEEIKLKGLTGQILSDVLDEQEKPGHSEQALMSKDLFPISTAAGNRESITPYALDQLSKELVVQGQSGTDLQALDEKVKSMMEKGQKMISNGKQTANGTPMQKTSSICKVCGKEGRWNQIRDHIESNHLEGVSIPCDHCGKTLSTRLSLCKHKSRFHK